MNAWMPWATTAGAVALLAGIATASLTAMRVPGRWAVVAALARAALQLTALSLVLAGIITSPLWVGVGLMVMFIAAVWTAARRSGTAFTHAGPLVLSMLVGPTVVMTVAFATGAIELAPRYALALGGIVIGNTMTITILTERVYRASIRDHWDQVEGWLALGATPWESTRELARGAIQTALLPSLDQTRTTGVVVLPGAFVGAIFAGASPFDAGRFQIVVLAGALASGAVSAVLLLRITGRDARQPADIHPVTRKPAQRRQS